MDTFKDCTTIQNLNNIIQGLNLQNNINDLLQQIYTRTQNFYGPDRTSIECHIFASIINCILQHNNTFNVRVISNANGENQLPDLRENEVATLYLIPPIGSVEYHFITICPVGDNYVIYSANGNYFVPVFNVSKTQFNIWYTTILTKNGGDLQYPDDGDINNTDIAIAWHGLTHINLAEDFQRIITSHDEEDAEDEEDTEDEEDVEDEEDADDKFKMTPQEIWDEYMKDFKRKSYPRDIIWVYTRQQPGGKRKAYKKRNTNKKRKNNKKRKTKRRKH